LIDQAQDVDGIRLVVAQLPGANSGVMRKLIDQLRKKAAPVGILFVSQIADDKLLLATGLSRDLVERGMHAGHWIKEIAPIVGGRGGGKPDMAQAGGTDVEQIPHALTAAVETFKSMV
jgi:alanyl-tRNA synthetase